MLRITIDLIPHGDESKKETISMFEVGNTGEVNKYKEYKYNYNGHLADHEDKDYHLKFSGRVQHDRRLPVFFLLYKILFQIMKPFGHKYSYDDKERVKALKEIGISEEDDKKFRNLCNIE